MRFALPAIAVVLVLMFAPFIPPPVGPGVAEAMDEPAFVDGGCNVGPTDAGSTVTIDTYRTSSWNASFSVRAGDSVCYKFCEASTGTDPATCSASRTVCPGGPLTGRSDTNGTTFDIAVPGNRRFLSFTSADAGTSFNVCVGVVTP